MIDPDLRKIGRIAHTELEQGGEFTVFGQTSKGIFLLAPSKRVVFLSYSTQISPLTCQVSPSKQLLALQAGDKVLSRDGSLILEFSSIDFRSTSLWTPNQPFPRKPVATIKRLRTLVKALKEPDEPNSLYAILGQLVLNTTKKIGQEDRRLESIKRLIAAFKAGDSSGVALQLIKMLGEGRGLTPSGDDFAVGVLLSINRYMTNTLSDGDKNRLNETIFTAAEQKTTRLSISMIWAANQGGGDSRLIDTTDYLFSGIGNATLIADKLNSYGSSSGVDTLCGMAAVVIAECK